MDMWFVLGTPSDLKNSSPSPSGLKASRKSAEQEQPSEVEEEIIEVCMHVVFFQHVFPPSKLEVRTTSQDGTTLQAKLYP